MVRRGLISMARLVVYFNPDLVKFKNDYRSETQSDWGVKS
jgi:hypothetical protein